MAMKLIPTSLALLAAVALTLGCQQSGDTSIDTATQKVKAQHTGPEQQLIAALYSLDLRPDQRKTLEVLVTDAQVQLQPSKQAVADLMREAAKGIRKGNVNEERLRILAENLKGEFHKARPLVINTLNTVHKTLDKSQREQLVATLRAKHKARMAERFGQDAADSADNAGHHSHHRGHMKRGHHKMRRIAEKLGLSKSQKGRIKDVIQRGIAAMHQDQPAPEARMKQRHEKIRAAVESFLTDDFDAAKLPFLDKPHMPGLKKLEKIMRLGNVVLPIFSEDQRAKIATHLEFRADLVAPLSAD
jgi:Spy/CpxP family protein refolding chaperone